MKKDTILSSPSIYKDTISPNTVDLNNSYRKQFSSEQQIYKRGNGHPNSVALQKIMLKLYGINEKYTNQIVISSSGVSSAVAMSISRKFKRILCDKLYPEMIESFGTATQVERFKSVSQIQEGDLVCIESFTLPECINNYQKIKLICEYAHLKNAHVYVDNSSTTGYVWNPFEAGVDICMESLAKNANGFNTSLISATIFNPESSISTQDKDDIIDSFRYLGFYPNPIDCYLTILGLQTLSLRMDKIKNTTERICGFLRDRKIRFNSICECGLVFLSADDAIKSKIPKINLKYIQSAGVFGVNFTVLDIMESVPFLRISIGLENCDDILEDIKTIISIYD